MRKLLVLIALLMFMSIPALAALDMGYLRHEFQVVDELGRARTDINSVTIRTAATTDAQTIYATKFSDSNMVQPVTETSADTTLDRDNGTMYWYGVDGWDFTITLDSGTIYANNGHMSLNPSINRIIFPSYLAAVNTSTFTLTDAQTITLGTDSDWTIKSNVAKNLNILPATTDETSIVNIGANTTGADLKLFGATTGVYWLWDSSADSMITVGAPITATGAAVNLNASSNFAVNIASGTSTGTVTVGGTGVQTIDIGTGGTGAKTIGIGDGASTGATTIKGGSGGVAVNASNGTVATNIGTGTSTGTVTIGSATTTQAIAVNAGTGDLALTSTDDITLTTNTAVTDNIVITNTQGTAATALSLQATAGGIDIDGGSGADISITSTGKSVAVTATEAVADAIALTATTGAGGITASSGSGGINLNASVNQPVNVGTGTSSGTITLGGGSGLLAIETSSWDVATDGTMTNIGAITSGGLFTGTAGETITGATVNLNASSNFNTNINTGTSTGAVSIGSSTSGAFAVDTTSTVTVNADASQAYTVTDTVAGNAFTWNTTDGGMAFTAAGTANGDFSITAGDDLSLASTGNIDIQGAADSTINIGDAAQTAAITIGASTATMTDLSLGTGVGAHTIHIGDGGTASQSVTMGSQSGASPVIIQSGTGDVTLKSTDDIAIGSDAVAQDVFIGNETGTSSLVLKAGSGNITMDGVAGTTITIGDAAQTGIMKFGESSATGEVDIGTGTGARTINIGTGGTGIKTITIGDAASTGATIIKSGSGNMELTTPKLIIDGAAAQLIEIEGTADGNEVTLSFTDPTADVTFAFPVMAAQTVSVMSSTLATNAPDIANSVWGGTNGLKFEGAAVDDNETTLSPQDPTADNTLTLPDDTGTIMTSTLATNGQDVADSIWGGTNQLIFEGLTANGVETILTVTDPTSADKTITLPDASGTVMLSDAGADLALGLFQSGQDLKYEGTTANDYESMIRFHGDAAADYILAIPSDTGFAILSDTDVDGIGAIWADSSQLIFEGATADACEVVITATDPTADVIWTLPDAAAQTVSFMSSTLATNMPQVANSVWGGTSQIIAEGSSADACEVTLAFTNPTTGDFTVTVPAKTGEIKLSSAAVALTTTATAVPLTVGLSNVYTDTIVTDNNDQTITFSGAGTAGDELTIIFTTDTGGSNDEIITFESTLVTSTGTLTLANVTAKSYLITFISNGTRWYEKSRTTVSTSP